MPASVLHISQSIPMTVFRVDCSEAMGVETISESVESSSCNGWTGYPAIFISAGLKNSFSISTGTATLNITLYFEAGIRFRFCCSLARCVLWDVVNGQFKNADTGEYKAVFVPGAFGNHMYLNISGKLDSEGNGEISSNRRIRFPSEPRVSILNVCGESPGTNNTTQPRIADRLRISIQFGGFVSSNIHNTKSRKSCH